MLVMLPAGITAILSLVGLSIAPIAAWAAPLIPLAPFLFMLSIVFLVIGHLRCGWQPASVVALGGALVYLAMYVLVTPIPSNAITGTPMPGMAGGRPADIAIPGMAGLTNAPLFYAGLVLIAGSFGLVWRRRKTNVCQPITPLGVLRSILATRRN